MSQFTASPGKQFVSSPGHQLDATPLEDFDEEAEILIATDMDPVAVSGYNYTAQSPTSVIDEAEDNMDWGDIAAYTAYANYNNSHIHDLVSSPTIPPRILTAPLWSNSGGILELLSPAFPATGSVYWQRTVAQSALWIYLPYYQSIPPNEYWSNSTYAQRCRFRCNRAVRVWTATADFYAQGDVHLDNPGDILPENVTLNEAQARLEADTWKELTIPAGSMPNLSTGFLGKVTFAVFSETVEAWETRTGISIS